MVNGFLAGDAKTRALVRAVLRRLGCDLGAVMTIIQIIRNNWLDFANWRVRGGWFGDSQCNTWVKMDIEWYEL